LAPGRAYSGDTMADMILFPLALLLGAYLLLKLLAR